MSDIKLFRLTNGIATELQGCASDLEKLLQTLIEVNLQPSCWGQVLQSNITVLPARHLHKN